MPTTIVESVRIAANENPDSIFCAHYNGDECTVITYRDLLERSCAMAGRLREKGCGTNSVVLIFVQHQPEQYYAFLACMLIGAIPSFMPYPNAKQDTALFWKSHASLLQRIQPQLLVVSDRFSAGFMENLPDYKDLLHTAEDAMGSPVSPQPSGPDEPALMQHSSGTTGLKKGVVLSHREVLAQVDAYQAAIRLTREDVIASWLPLYHDMGLIACFMQTIIVGATLVALDPFEWVRAPSTLLQAIERHRATLCWLPNFAFNHIALATRRGKSFDLTSIRAFVNCSEPCKADSFDVFHRRFADCGVGYEKLQVCYAMAENVFAVTQTALHQAPRILQIDRKSLEEDHRAVAGDGPRMLSCGPPVAGVTLRIVSIDGDDLESGMIGEIAIRSDFLFSGYYRQPDVTERKLRDGWYYTGDLGFVAHGELFVTGRLDDLLINYGKNYYAHEIEAIVSRVDGVIPGRCVAFAVPLEGAGTDQVVLQGETAYTEDHQRLSRSILQAVQDGCGLTLGKVELCAHGTLIKTSSGKISREANRSRFIQTSENLKT